MRRLCGGGPCGWLRQRDAAGLRCLVLRGVRGSGCAVSEGEAACKYTSYSELRVVVVLVAVVRLRRRSRHAGKRQLGRQTAEIGFFFVMISRRELWLGSRGSQEGLCVGVGIIPLSFCVDEFVQVLTVPSLSDKWSSKADRLISGARPIVSVCISRATLVAGDCYNIPLHFGLRTGF